MDAPTTLHHTQNTFLINRPLAPFNEPAPWRIINVTYLDRTAIYSMGNQALATLKERGVVVKDENKTLQFLIRHSDLVGHLYKLPSLLAEHFGLDATSVLEVVFEMDFPTNDQQLFFTINTTLPMEDAYARLLNLEEQFIYPLQDAGITSLTLDINII